ncbi:hypothetical protein H0H87_006104 [Tephrocybe sp. NHM501043]|nr:hypothetical protein H0H87_006104 [Tephrocybe sp. NHM501043]
MSRPTKRARKDVSDSEVEKVQNLQEYQLQDMPDAEVFYMPGFVGHEKATEWYTGLLELDSCMSTLATIQSRKIAAYATDKSLTLKYSGQEVDMKYEYPPMLRQIQDEVEGKLGTGISTLGITGTTWRIGGRIAVAGIYTHRYARVIASVSLGAPRTFIMTHDAPKTAKATRSSKKPRSESSSNAQGTNLRKQWTLESGSLVVMQGDTQRFWKHMIPKWVDFSGLPL